jgi:uncharacterized heparinase superfamily protein
MSRVSIADRGRLSWLALCRGFDELIGRLRAHPIGRVPFVSGRAEQLVIAPQDLRTADPTYAREIYRGRFAFAGKIVVCEGRSPFDVVPPSDEWAEAMLGFGWLRHLRVPDPSVPRANARGLVDEWIALQGRFHPVSWQPEILSRRIIAWVTHAPLILQDADVAFYRRFARSLARQVRFLRSTARVARDGIPRLRARMALTFAALCMANQGRHLRNAVRGLVIELDRQVLPDGGHISRNPGALIELMLDLLPLGQAFAARNLAPPSAVMNAVDRIMPMLRFFRHGDGRFALFNGMGPSHPDLLATILAYDDAYGASLPNPPYSGYQRLQAAQTIVIMDTGAPPPFEVSAEAHAGCLSFELSTAHRIVVNCGLPEFGKANWRELARSTAAHSTLTFNDTSSCRFLATGSFRRLFGSPVIEGPHKIQLERDADGKGLSLRAAHDGYLHLGAIHQRRLSLAADGSRLEGEDELIFPRGRPRARDRYAVRFHLHPMISAKPRTDGNGVTLVLPNREVWSFRADGAEIVLEDSVFLADQNGPRRTTQIIIVGEARKSATIAWRFAQERPERRDAARTWSGERQIR